MTNCRISPDRFSIHPTPDVGPEDTSATDPCDGFDAQREQMLRDRMNQQARTYDQQWGKLHTLLKTRYAEGPPLESALKALAKDPTGRKLLEDRQQVFSNLDCLKKSTCSKEPVKVIESTGHLLEATTKRLSAFLVTTNQTMFDRYKLEKRVSENTARVKSDWIEVTNLLRARPDLASMDDQVIWTTALKSEMQKLDAKLEDLNSDSPDVYRLEVLKSVDKLLRLLAPDMAHFHEQVKQLALSSPGAELAEPR